MSSVFPCIHHGIEVTGSVYLYRPETNLSISTHGCFTIVKKKRQIVGWRIIGRLMQLAFLMVSFQRTYSIGWNAQPVSRYINMKLVNFELASLIGVAQFLTYSMNQVAYVN